MAVGSDTLVGSLDIYSAVKQNKDKIPGMSATNDELGEFFKRTREKKDPESDTEKKIIHSFILRARRSAMLLV